MTELFQSPGRFREIARLKLADSHVQSALDGSTARLGRNRVAAWAELPEAQALREQAYAARMRVIDDLDRNVEQFSSALAALGGRPVLARTAEEACSYVADVCRRRGAALAAKSNSMVSEEIGLNSALEDMGVTCSL